MYQSNEINKLIILLIIIVLIVIIIMFLWKHANYEYITSTNGLKFRVISGKDGKEAAEILAELNGRVNTLLSNMKRKYENGNDTNAAMYKKLADEYDFDDFEENPDETFVIGKGNKINVCLRDANGKFYPINELMFVVLHELAHIITIEYNHLPQFWRNANFLLSEAIISGIYIAVDYSLKPFMYCNNIYVNSNPYLDTQFKMLLNNKNINENEDIGK